MSLSATELGAAVVGGALQQSGLNAEVIDEAFIGNVMSANLGQAPAKQACLKAGLPDSVPCTTVNKVCASGMKAVMLGVQSIMAGTNEVVLAGGMESMSNVPFYLPHVRGGHKMGHSECVDGMIRDGLWDPYEDKDMGSFAEKCAKRYQITREEQDAYAIQSFERAIAAGDVVKDEITPVTIRDRKGKEHLVSSDEGIQKFSKEKMKVLKPVFEASGTVTAGNSSQISDGAAALILARRSKAEELGMKVLATVVGMADAAQHPSWFTTTPSLAVDKLLEKSSVKKEDVNLFEINEAFAVVALANQRLLRLDPSKINVRGGAVALGHPLGCSGARILVTLIHALRARNGGHGIAAICNGGGGASAILLKCE